MIVPIYLNKITTWTVKSVIIRSKSAGFLVSMWKNKPTWCLGIQHHLNKEAAHKNSGKHVHQHGKYKNAFPKICTRKLKNLDFWLPNF